MSPFFSTSSYPSDLILRMVSRSILGSSPPPIPPPPTSLPHLSFSHIQPHIPLGIPLPPPSAEDAIVPQPRFYVGGGGFRDRVRERDRFFLLTSIYKFGLSVCLSVCLFVSNKRQNGWTDRAQIFCGTSHDPREGFWMIKFSKICLHQNSIFENFENPRICFWKSAKFFFMLFVNKENPCVFYFEYNFYKWNKRS